MSPSADTRHKAMPAALGVRQLSRLELTVVLFVIGLLAALLLQGLSTLHDAVRAARLQSAAAAARTAAVLFHTRCTLLRAADGRVDCAWLTLAGVPVAGAHGWPAASAEGIVRAAGLDAAPGPGVERFRWRVLAGRAVPALAIGLPATRCEFVYVQAAGPDAIPEVGAVDPSCH